MQKIVWVFGRVFISFSNQSYFLPLIYPNQPVSVILEIDSSLDNFYNVNHPVYESIFNFQIKFKQVKKF